MTDKNTREVKPAKKENVQIRQRLTKAIVPVDKLSQRLFELSPEEFIDMVKHGVRSGCLEGQDKAGKDVVTWFQLEEAADYVGNGKPFTAFQREVLFAVISAYEQGLRTISISMTLDTLTGGKEKRNVHIEQYEAIKAAFEKLGGTSIKVDLKPLLEAYPKYRKRRIDSAFLYSPILPCKVIDARINGQMTLAIELLSESPIMTVAKMKRQILTYDLAPLALPNQHATPRVIVIKNYLLRRIEEIKQGRFKSNSILLETLYRNCDLSRADKWQKQDARKVITETLESFKREGVIKNFEWKKQFGGFKSITLEI